MSVRKQKQLSKLSNKARFVETVPKLKEEEQPKKVEKKPMAMPLKQPADPKRNASEEQKKTEEQEKVYLKPRPKSPTKAVTPGILQRQEEKDKKKQQERALQEEADKAQALLN